MNQRITEYQVLIVEATTDPETNETCGGDHYNMATLRSKRKAMELARKLTTKLKNCYEIHVYEETNADVCGHWIFKQGTMTHNQFNN
jgi:hypothetical protein